MRKRQRVKLSGLVFSIGLIAIYSFYPTSNPSNIKKRAQKILSHSSCNPIIENAPSQFRVLIDGEIYPKIIPSYHNTSLNFTCLNRLKRRPSVILLWNEYNVWHDWRYGLGSRTPFIKNKCPVTNCEITKDKSRLNESDLVLVHMIHKVKKNDLPLDRPRSSRLVFFRSESNIYSAIFNEMNGLFNMTSTFRTDSDFVPFYYGNVEFEWRLNPDFDPDHDYLKPKTGLAIFLVSHCTAYSKRMDYARQMQKYMPVDIIGECGQSCNITNDNRFLSSKNNECRSKISKKYMFLLAFENSSMIDFKPIFLSFQSNISLQVCTDYVTEKFFDTVLYDIVPIVMGAGPYDTWIPRSGFIDIRDFQTVKDLTDYLVYLSTNSTAYNAYFSWKKYIVRTNHMYKTFCDMCIKLQLESYYGTVSKVVDYLPQYWDKHQTCFTTRMQSNRSVFTYVPYSP